jgi:hypothetical protein
VKFVEKATEFDLIGLQIGSTVNTVTHRQQLNVSLQCFKAGERCVFFVNIVVKVLLDFQDVEFDSLCEMGVA